MQWALEELGLTYRVHALDHTAGDLDSDEFSRVATADFTLADVMMAGALRTIRKTDLMDPFPRIPAYFERCRVRPAWQRTLAHTRREIR